jgi:hypothetical protein
MHWSRSWDPQLSILLPRPPWALAAATLAAATFAAWPNQPSRVSAGNVDARAFSKFQGIRALPSSHRHNGGRSSILLIILDPPHGLHSSPALLVTLLLLHDEVLVLAPQPRA